jgi:hypothetical protein
LVQFSSSRDTTPVCPKNVRGVSAFAVGSVYAQVAKVRPEGLVLCNIAECYKQMGQGDVAMEWFRRAIDLEPLFLRSYQLAAVCRYQMGSFIMCSSARCFVSAST